MGVSLGLRQGPKHAQASFAGVVLSLPGRDSYNAAAPGEKEVQLGNPQPPTRSPWSLCASPQAVVPLVAGPPVLGLRRPVDPWAPQAPLLHRLAWLVSSVRKGDIGAVTERLGEWAQSVGITSVPGMVGAGRHRWIRPPQLPSLCQAETQTPAWLKRLFTGPGHWVYPGELSNATSSCWRAEYRQLLR